MKILRTSYIWVGDGFSSGNDQIGKPHKNNRGRIIGKVVDGTDMCITVEFFAFDLFIHLWEEFLKKIRIRAAVAKK
jgi:hypothetical protein